jgi:hypothetical protein
MVSKRLSGEAGHRRKFMAIVDDTPECIRAVRYAGRRAKNSNGGLVLCYIIPQHDAQEWIGVQEIIRAEARKTAISRFWFWPPAPPRKGRARSSRCSPDAAMRSRYLSPFCPTGSTTPISMRSADPCVCPPEGRYRNKTGIAGHIR